ncbi:hypothetical protein [Paenibacillus thermotolerans]|uniref:hypothetical protein n=1 Tax=Paenibacillus thermotolerans TaxID=3027807 RepID=UPI002368114D|nr:MULTISPECIES: hypothetical protein [unclassified Paenibacillus]
MNRNAMTARELANIADHVDNEALLAQLCVQAAEECANPQLRGFFAHQAELHRNNLKDLNDLLQKYAGHSR